MLTVGKADCSGSYRWYEPHFTDLQKTARVQNLNLSKQGNFLCHPWKNKLGGCGYLLVLVWFVFSEKAKFSSWFYKDDNEAHKLQKSFYVYACIDSSMVLYQQSQWQDSHRVQWWQKLKAGMWTFSPMCFRIAILEAIKHDQEVQTPICLLGKQ